MKRLWIATLTTLIGLTARAEEMPPIKTMDLVESSGLLQEVYPVHPAVKGEGAISFRPIGYFRSPYSEKTGAPRQGILEKETEATIQIDEIYRKGLVDLGQFEYIIVIYWFDRTQTWSTMVNPPKSQHHFGVFATRSPKRPNPIGFSIVRLDGIDLEAGILYLSGVDAFDGTPVLDIKPYLPSIDIVQSPKNIETEKQLGHHDEKYINDPTMYR